MKWISFPIDPDTQEPYLCLLDCNLCLTYFGDSQDKTCLIFW